MLTRLWIVFVVLWALGAVMPAQAHGYIVRAIPENRAVLERPPTRLQYWFSEGLEPDFSTLNLRNQAGDVIASGGVSENDNTLMTLQVPNDLPDGAYIVELRPAFASDGHVVAESRVFFVGEEIGGVAGAGATDQAIPLEVVWRIITIMSSMLLFGALTVYSLVMVPAWGNPKHEAGLLPSRVMRRLNVIVGYALAVAFFGNALALIQQTMTFFNIGFSQALNPDFWSLVRVGSRFGDIWNWRIFFLGLIGVMFLLSMAQRQNQPQLVRPYLVAGAWMAALILGSQSVLSHAAGSLLWPWVGITSDWLHRLAVGFWAGGLAVLVLVLPVALQPYTGEQRRMALLAALRRFSPIAFAAVLIVVSTGIYAATNWIFGIEEIETPFTGSLALKLVMIAGLLGIGALHHLALNPERYARWQRLAGVVRGWMPTLRLEAVFVFLVLGAAGLLGSTPVPIPSFAQTETEAPTQALDVDDLTVVMSVLPGGPGVNTHDTIITRDGERITDLTLSMINVHPAGDVRSDTHPVEPVEDGLYVTATADIDDVGRWWSLLDITLPDGDVRRAAFDWEITNDAAVIQSINPNAANIAALMAVLLACAWTAYPFVMRAFAALNLDVFSVSVAFAAIVMTIIAMVGGYQIVQQTRQQYADTLNPPPEYVNAVLPTAASLERGATLYAEYCIGWQSQPRDFNDLRDSLPTIRDEDLYLALAEGWRDLSACGAELSFYQRWDVVNYLRTLAR
jgi:putative copper export protein/methionine-rich copper-binding protein CopC